jgi:hypothetical protein
MATSRGQGRFFLLSKNMQKQWESPAKMEILDD